MSSTYPFRTRARSLVLLAALAVIASLLAVVPPNLTARAANGTVNLSVYDRETGDPITEFRYAVNVDIAHDNPSTVGPESFSPVMAHGDQTTASSISLPPGKYLVSVIGGANAPAPGEYKLSGTHFTVTDGGSHNVRVDLVPEPLPVSQIQVEVFHDNISVNGARDIPGEVGLEGFAILLEDGTGEVSVDFWGNPICSEYDGDPAGDFPPGNLIANSGGQCLTGPDGIVTIPNLAAHKYGAFAVPPDGSGWIQTATLEGTHVIDAWIEEGNTGTIAEFGLPTPLISLGYVQECDFGFCPQVDENGNPDFPASATVAPGDATVVGTVREATEIGEAIIETGPAVDRPYIALNNLSGNDEQVYTGRGNPDGSFSIPDVPPGTYQVVVWDEPQLYIISFETTIVTEADQGGTVDMGDILVPGWFGHIEGFAYWDTGVTQNGQPINNVPSGGVNGKPDGYANGFRDCLGDDPFDYPNCEPGIPGQDFVVHFNDGSVKYGGVADSHGYYSFDEHFPYGHYLIWEVGFGRFKQMYTTGYFSHFVDGEKVVDGYPYTPENKTTETGGASLLQAEITLSGYYNWIDTGKLPYGTPDTGAEYENGGISGVVRYGVTRNEFDPRLAAAEDYEPGVPGVTVNLYQAALDASQQPIACEEAGPGCPYGNGELMRVSTSGTNDPDPGDLVDSVESDSYYELRPEECYYPDPTDPTGTTDIFDPVCVEAPINIRQIQDGAFDGGYAFDPLPVGAYIVEMVAPDHYRHIKEEDQNTDQGDDFIPAVPPPACAGQLHLVNDARNPADGTDTPLCDAKFVRVTNGTNPPADFYLMVDFDDSVDGDGLPVEGFQGTTEVPQPALMRGTLFDDLTVQFDPTSLMFGGKKGVPDTPVGILDFQGNEIAVTYTDSDGFFEVLLPSSYTRLCPTPGGVCAGIYLVVGNYPGQDPSNPIEGWNPNYQTLTLPLDVWPGKTTYADVAILPRSGFGFATAPVCVAEGPVVDSVSDVVIPRPGQNGLTISGDGFGGTAGVVTIGGEPVPTSGWGNNSITVTDVPNSVAYGPQQLLVTAVGGAVSESGITIHVTSNNSTYNPPVLDVGQGQTYTSIQAAIDAAVQPADSLSNAPLIVVHPGTYYESPIIDKRVKLQGFGPGPGGTFIDGRFLGFGAAPIFDPAVWALGLPATVVNPAPGGAVLGGNENVPVGQVVTLVAETPLTYNVGGGAAARARRAAQIDGFTIIGGESLRGENTGQLTQGGGIYLHAAVHNLRVSNNTVQSNAGNTGGGIILGQPYVGDNDNDDAWIHNNRILNNGGTILAGGIGIFTGAEDYLIDHNVICGNHSAEYGGGISHYGRSFGGNIEDNRIVFNSAFDEGGGIIIAGEQPVDAFSLTEGSGRVDILRNLIQYNLSNDDGGGIRLLSVESLSTGPRSSDRVFIINNMVVNNVATDFGGGIALDDAPDTRIVNNTVAKNVSTATAEDADTTSCGTTLPFQTCPHAAGITSTPHSAALAANTNPDFSNPLMFNNIVAGNEAFYRTGIEGVNPLASAGLNELEVVGLPGEMMKPKYSVLTSAYGTGEGNQIDGIDGVLAFISAITTDFRATPLIGAPNFVGVEILATPSGLQGDYHLTLGSLGVDDGTDSCNGNVNPDHCNGSQVSAPDDDFDGDVRPSPANGDFDIGADEVPQ